VSGDGAVTNEAAGPVWNVDMKVLKIAGAALAAVIVVVALLLIIGIPTDFLTSAMQARVERETGYRLTISGATRIGIWPSLNVTLNDVTLQDPKDRDSSDRLTVGSVQADMSLASLWSGHPEITELVIVRPVLHVPLLRERSVQPALSAKTSAGSPASSSSADGGAVLIDHVKVSDGSIAFANLRDRVEDHIDGINVEALIGGDRKIAITGTARASSHPLKFAIKATPPSPPTERQNIPVELTLEAPDVLQTPLSGKAEVRINGSVIMINGLSGALGDGAFDGWASVDIASKPLVKVDLDFQRLDLAGASAAPGSQQVSEQGLQQGSQQGSEQPWSNVTIDLTGLNYVDAQVRVSAAEVNFAAAHIAPAEVNAALAGGVLRAAFSNLGAYGGQASGELIADVSTGSPAYALHGDLVGVRALPLLHSAADFDRLDGKLQAKLALRASGASPRAIMSSLSGTVFAVFQDGAIRGVNVAQMIRSLTSSTLSGWQQTGEQTTDLTQLSASFKIDKGQATTADLNLVGPLVRVTGAGTVDLAAKSLALRVEPKLVMTTEGQGRAADPVGLGIPVVIDGPWAEPRIYPDMAGIMDNPDAAYAKLKEMGKGLFGANSPLGGLAGNGAGDSSGLSNPLGGKLGETLGNLLQQGLGQSRNIAPPTSSGAAAQPTPAPAASDPPPQQQDSQPMNEVLRQLFNR
jgi:AsmA protein